MKSISKVVTVALILFSLSNNVVCYDVKIKNESSEILEVKKEFLTWMADNKESHEVSPNETKTFGSGPGNCVKRVKFWKKNDIVKYNDDKSVYQNKKKALEKEYDECKKKADCKESLKGKKSAQYVEEKLKVQKPKYPEPFASINPKGTGCGNYSYTVTKDFKVEDGIKGEKKESEAVPKK